MVSRVVITGIGMITSLGNTVSETWNGLLRGQSGVSKVESFDTSDYPVRIGAETKGFNPELYMDRKDIRRNDRFVHFAVGAAKQAIQDSGLDIQQHAEDVGVVIGSGIGGLNSMQEQFRLLNDRGPGRISPFFVTMIINDMAAGITSIELGAGGPNFSVVSACATSSHALGESFEMIRRGDARAMITGGAEAAITPMGMAAFASMRALSQRNDDPEHASRPFDAKRDGFVMGDGAGIVVLEDLELAQERGAHIYAEVVGYGATADAYHITEPAPGGSGLVRAMRRALQKANITPEQVDYINAHGTSTIYNDATETAAIKNLFKESASKVAISSTKSMIGHTLGAAGAIEAIITTLAIHESEVPPTINYEEPDPACDLDYVPNRSRQMDVKYALSNSMGFGGHNACLAFKKYEA